MNEIDVGKNRVTSTINKLQELNYYVKVDSCMVGKKLPITENEILKDLKLQEYDIIVLTECDYET